MKRKIKAPYFEVGVKNYLYGDDVFELALAAEKAAIEYDIDVLFIAPYVDIRRIAENTERLVVLAPYMDLLRPGRGVADVLPESLKAAGAHGVLMNHCERPFTLTQLKESIERANELDLLSFVCADTIAECKAIAHLGPDIINPEVSSNIGQSGGMDMDYVRESIRAIKEINSSILVEQAAGINSGQQVYDLIYEGVEACGAASGICCSSDPIAMVTEMIRMVRVAHDARKEKGLE